MSWSINQIGERTAVRKSVESNVHLPKEVKDVILATIHERLPEHAKLFNGVRVEGYGHHNANDDSALGNIGKLEIVPIQLVT